jgi:hypothetical protein
VESNVAFSVFSYLKAALARPSSACCFVAARMVFMRAGYSIADGFPSNRIARHRDIPNATLDLKALFCVRPCLLRPLVFHSQVNVPVESPGFFNSCSVHRRHLVNCR